MADALLARETLDAEQVKRLAAGLPLDESRRRPPTPRAGREAQSRRGTSGRQAIVPALPPRPVTQE